MPSGSHYIQFPDLTEIYVSTYVGSKYNSSGGYIERQQFEITGNFETEFVFGTILTSESRQYRKNLIGYGFQHVSSMINWSPFHLDCRALELWWWKNPNPTQLHPNPQPRYWDSGYRGWLSKNCQASGCGLKLHNKYLAHRSVWRFHTLMRMPIKPTAKQL